MDGHQYEYQCAKVLRSKGFTKVSVTKGSGDQGVDVIAYSGGKKYGIQCKYYTSPVGNHAVQEAFAGAKFYNCDVAVVMTNNTFTPAAKDLAGKTGVLLWANNRIPLGINSFWLTKFIGIFVCFVSILGLITMRGVDNIKFPVLQVIELALLIAGGLFAIFEYKKWGMSLLSGTFYFFACVMDLIYCAIAKNVTTCDFLIYIYIALLSFVRADYLLIKESQVHIWSFFNKNKKMNNEILTEEKRNIEMRILFGMTDFLFGFFFLFLILTSEGGIAGNLRMMGSVLFLILCGSFQLIGYANKSMTKIILGLYLVSVIYNIAFSFLYVPHIVISIFMAIFMALTLVSFKERENILPDRKLNENDGKYLEAKKETVVEKGELEKINEELSEALKNYGNIYVNFFNEHFYVNSSLIDSRTVGNNSTEFIIKCDTLEQAQYVVSREDELNQNLQSTHKMTLLANNCISLIVMRN